MTHCRSGAPMAGLPASSPKLSRGLCATLLLAVVMLTCAPANSSAAAVLPIAEIYPGAGAEVTQSPGFYLEFAGSYAHMEFPVIEVASHDILGADGTLSDDYRVDFVAPEEHQDHAGWYAAHTSGTWPNTPGTYYWQARGTLLEENFQQTEYVSEVFMFRVTGLGRVEPTPLPVSKPIAPSSPPAPPGPPSPAPVSPVSPGLTPAQARRLVRTIIARHTGHQPSHLTQNCARRSSGSVSCRANWLTGAPRSPRTLLYAGTFKLAVRGGAISATFVGVSARYRCERHSGMRRCESKVRWHR
jgi:hypothetical protein